jgi:hypothetical protein
MTKATGRILLFGLLLSSACIGRPSLEESSQELSGLIDPALESWNADYESVAKRFDQPDSCSDPFIGPRDGLRATLTYEFPFSVLGDDPMALLTAVEQHWKSQGFETRVDETELVKIRFSGKEGYPLSVVINYSAETAWVEGSGPCVDNPET